MSLSLSLVLPAYNEVASLPRAIEQCTEVAGALPNGSFEAVIVDDGSVDGSQELLARAAGAHPWLRVARHDANQGYGAALRTGFRLANNEVVAYSDSDNQFRFLDFITYLDLLGDVDMVAGYRVNRLDAGHRLLVSSVYNQFARIMFQIPVKDVNCSFKLMRHDRLKGLDLTSSDFFIDTELLARARIQGWRILEVGVSHHPRVAGRTTVNPLDVPRTLLQAIRMWWRLRSGRPSQLRSDREITKTSVA